MTEAMIHPTAIIHPGARLDSTVSVGPHAVIDENVVLGPGCRVGPRVYLTGQVFAGAHNRFHAGAVIGDAPQDLRYAGAPTGVIIGDHNTFREHVTVHRSNDPSEPTRIGSHNFFMAGSHAGHNSQIGDHVILANGALLGGHVTVEDRAFISGNCLVHQFVRVGFLSFMQGGAGISMDLPPFTMASGVNSIRGLNVVGLRRCGFNSEQRLELKRLYQTLFRSGKNLNQALAAARETFHSEPALRLMNFIAAAKRGVCPDTSRRGGRVKGESERGE